jgi:ribosomal protein S12 methylthiotransferase accessory factor
MLVKPRFKQCYAVEVLPPAALFLLSEYRHLVFEGEAYVHLAPLLNGQHTFTEITAKLGEIVFIPNLYAAVQQLTRRGCLGEADGVPLPEHAAFWDHFGASGEQVGRLAETAVRVTVLGALDEGLVREAFSANGLRVAAEGAWEVVVTDDYLRPELAGINRRCLQAGKPWMLCKPLGLVVWVGPFFRPQRTGCWECLRQRLEVNRQSENFIRRRAKEPVRFQTSRAQLPATLQVGLHLAATELARALVLDRTSAEDGKVLTLDLLSLEMQEHVLVRRPQCPVCGDPAVMEAKPIVLQPSPRGPGGGHEYRSVAPEQTWERCKHLVSPITGAVHSVVSREVSEQGPTHTFSASHYFPVVLDDINALRVNLLARSGGKGTTAAQARTSALGESLERYSGIAWGDEPVRHGSYAELGPLAVPARELLHYSEAQRRNWKPPTGTTQGDFHAVFPALPDDAPIAWSPAWSLTNQGWRYLPKAYCFYGHKDPGPYFCQCDSNGSAAGNTPEEAILQGFLELVERDAVALWWYNRLRRPAVDVSSFKIPHWDKLRTFYRRDLHRDLQVLDLTSDLGIATFAAISRREDRPVEDILLGFSAHLDPRIALQRALQEANQCLPMLRYDKADGTTHYIMCGLEMMEWFRTATYATQPYVVADPDAPPKRLADFANHAAADFKQDVETCVELACLRGLEMLLVDQTRPDLGLPVVRVVVPGLRHFWRRLAPGRLYDVPVQMGWLREPLTEEQMNPISCII